MTAPNPTRSTPLTYADIRRAIFLVAALVVAWHLVEPLTTLLLLFLLVLILSAVLIPVVSRLERRGVPRTAATVALVLSLLLVGVGIGAVAVPPLVEEVSKFVTTISVNQGKLRQLYADLSTKYPDLASQIPAPEELARSLSPTVARLASQVGRYTANAFVGLASSLLVLVLVTYTVSQPKPLVTGLLIATPEELRGQTIVALKRILVQLKNWAWGSLTLGAIVGIMTGVGLFGLGIATGKTIPYLMLFSMLAGIGEMIPNVGPIVSSIPPALVAATIDPVLGLMVLGLFVVIQQLENHFIVPTVMGQSLNLHPISLTFTVLVMGALFGLLGAILAVPVCAIIKVCWEEYYVYPSGVDVEALGAAASDLILSEPIDPRAVVAVIKTTEAKQLDPPA